MRKIYHIAVEGTIGVGKTSLATRLSEIVQGRLILEEFEDNPFLREFYKDRKRWAFQTQINFLISRYYQQLRLQQVNLFSDKIVSDYISLIKQKINYRLGEIDSEREWLLTAAQQNRLSQIAIIKEEDAQKIRKINDGTI